MLTIPGVNFIDSMMVQIRVHFHLGVPHQQYILRQISARRQALPRMHVYGKVSISDQRIWPDSESPTGGGARLVAGRVMMAAPSMGKAAEGSGVARGCSGELRSAAVGEHAGA